MIDQSKKYKIRTGKEARIYALDGQPGREVHGAFKDESGWIIWAWDLGGLSITREDWVCRNLNEDYKSDFDLIEVE